jgi:hypothetical protein
MPVNVDHPDQLAEIVAELTALRGRDPSTPFDVAVDLPPGTDPAPYARAGATWWLVGPPWEEVSVDQVRSLIRTGPGLAMCRQGRQKPAAAAGADGSTK